MTITNSNLFSEGYNSIKSFLEGISSLDSRHRNKSNWIHSSIPNINSKGFEGYPFIVIRLDVNESSRSFDRDTSEKVYNVLIKVYSDEATEVDSISDKIFNNFKDETKLTDFKARELSSSPLDWNLDQNGKKILYRNIGLIMKMRL
jgi:hypothetical protein